VGILVPVTGALDPRRLAGRILDLAMPPACAGCGAEGKALCDECAPALAVRRGLPAGVPLGMPSDVPLPLVQLEWCAPFRGVVRDALHALKYAGERRLAEPLGGAAAARWTEAAIGGDLLVHVPVHPARRAVRGYDQAELLARAAAVRLGLPVRPALRRERATAPQFELDRSHRAANVRSAFAVDERHAAAVAGRWIVLVDDVVTTGATLVACADALLAAGAVAVSALTVARES
jgi:ComF family protein